MTPLTSGSLIVDPFAGSGTTGVAAIVEGHHTIIIEQVAEYAYIAVRRVMEAQKPQLAT